MQDVNPTLFFEHLSDNGIENHMDEVEGIAVHVVFGKRGAIIIPIFYDEIPGNRVAMYLELLGALYLLPYLVPDHPLADIAKRLPRV